MGDRQRRLLALVEVGALYVFTFLAIWAVHASPLGGWQECALRCPFLEYAVMAGVPVLFLCVRRRRLVAYGITFRKLRYQFDVALTCFVPIAAVNAVSFVVLRMDAARREGALLRAALEISLLLFLGWLLRRKATASGAGTLAGLFVFLPGVMFSATAGLADAGLGFLFYFLFLGPGEEVLFRGYMQSRLNEVFDRRYLFFGVPWGWGMIIMALLFGGMHLMNLPALFAGTFGPLWWRGFWTFFGGLVFGFLREKTGSVVAPALLHGLPQALASLVSAM